LIEIKEGSMPSFADAYVFNAALPIISFCFVAKTYDVILGLIDGTVMHLDTRNNVQTVVFKHLFAVRDILFIEDVLITADVGKTIMFSKAGEVFVEKTFENEIASISADKDLLIIGFIGSTICIGTPNQLKNTDFAVSGEKDIGEITSIAVNKEKGAFVYCTTEGRSLCGNFTDTQYGGFKTSHVEQLQLTPKVTYNSHQIDLSMINAVVITVFKGDIIFIYGTGDAQILIWNQSKKEVAFQHKCADSVTALDYNPDKMALVYATGYDWHKGIHGLKNVVNSPNFFVLILSEYDMRKKY